MYKIYAKCQPGNRVKMQESRARKKISFLALDSWLLTLTPSVNKLHNLSAGFLKLYLLYFFGVHILNMRANT